MHTHHPLPLTLSGPTLLGQLTTDDAPAPLADAAWYMAQALKDGLRYRFPTGALAEARFLSADFLLDGTHLAAFTLILQEGDEGPRFGYEFGLLNQCQARLRMPLAAVNQNRWLYLREGALLKPRSRFERVDLRRVDRLLLLVDRKSERPVRFCLTDFVASVDEPPRLETPLLPEGKLLDELGQSRLHRWPGKTQNAEELRARLRTQQSEAASQAWPSHFSRNGAATRAVASRPPVFSTPTTTRPTQTARAGGLSTPTAVRSGPPAWTACASTPAPAWTGWRRRWRGCRQRRATMQRPIKGAAGARSLAGWQPTLFAPLEQRDWYARWAEIALAQLRWAGLQHRRQLVGLGDCAPKFQRSGLPLRATARLARRCASRRVYLPRLPRRLRPRLCGRCRRLCRTAR